MNSKKAKCFWSSRSLVSSFESFSPAMKSTTGPYIIRVNGFDSELSLSAILAGEIPRLMSPN